MIRTLLSLFSNQVKNNCQAAGNRHHTPSDRIKLVTLNSKTIVLHKTQLLFSCVDFSLLYALFFMYLQCIVDVFPMYSRCISNVFSMYFQCIFNVFAMYFRCICNVLSMYFQCILDVFPMFSRCISNVFSMY